jgi:hypothetical protein
MILLASFILWRVWLVDLLTVCMSLLWGICALGLTTYVLGRIYLPILCRLRLSCLVRPLNGLLLFGYML